MINVIVKQKYRRLKKKRGLLDTSGHRLANLLGAYVHSKQVYPAIPSLVSVNWGNTSLKGYSGHLLNRPESVINSVDKLKTFELLKELPILKWTKHPQTTKDWKEVVCRVLSNSCSGKGIEITSPEDIVPAPLYTEYYTKKYEYRYHVFCGKVILVQQKRRLSSKSLEERGFLERPSSKIRNTENGYIYAIKDVPVNPDISSVCIKAIDMLGLDFGAVDILANDDDFKICEVNSAPGLHGTALTVYRDSILELL